MTAFVAEIVGAAGVIASLIYLAVQIRQSTLVARAEITKDLYLASRQAILDLASDEKLGEIWSDPLESEMDRVSRKLSGMLLQVLFNLPAFAILGYTGWITVQRYNLGNY